MLKHKLKSFAHSLYVKFVVWGYVRYGMAYGDELSYSYMGTSAVSREWQYNFFTKLYVALGYKPISIDDFVIAGGYRGVKYLRDKLKVTE